VDSSDLDKISEIRFLAQNLEITHFLRILIGFFGFRLLTLKSVILDEKNCLSNGWNWVLKNPNCCALFQNVKMTSVKSSLKKVMPTKLVFSAIYFCTPLNTCFWG